ncbi:WD40 repeat-like protein [Nemania sp. FL0031]|nr:WD40 repeat-like protein [Nemania sp. FL0031]
MKRIDAFTEAMESLGKSIETFLNTSSVVCFIWGPIKFILTATRNHLDALDKLLDVYSQVAAAIPGLQVYDATFREHPTLKTVIEDYFSDILLFHYEAISVFNRPRWEVMFKSVWKTFNSKFGPILQSLKNRRNLLDSEKISAGLYELHDLRKNYAKLYDEWIQRNEEEAKDKHRARVTRIRDDLGPPDYGEDQEIAMDGRHDDNSGKWIIADSIFEKWSNNDRARNDVLYVNGIPGAGKTTLMSTVIEHMEEETANDEKRCVAYFYFKHNEKDRRKHKSLLRAILAQLISHDDVLSDHFLHEISSIDKAKLRSTKTLEGLIKTALASYEVSYIVLDGLDECSRDQATKSINWFLSILKDQPQPTKTALRLLFCGQNDGNLEVLLAGQPSISLAAKGHQEDIYRYCQTRSKKITKSLGIEDMNQHIVSRVTEEAKGMFLYAYVVLENLSSLTTREDVQAEMAPDNFPTGIEKAAKCEDATKILGWIACARRHLRWREIQSLFCIDPIKGTVDYEGKRLRVSGKDVCGSFIEVRHATGKGAGPEDTVVIVHNTARQYLVQKKHIDAIMESTRLALFCFKYLTSEPFKGRLGEEVVTQHARNGYYALQDYAVRYWFQHVRECTKNNEAQNLNNFKEVTESTRKFLASYNPQMEKEKYKGDEEVVKIIEGLPEDGSKRNALFNIEYRTASIRQGIENLHGQQHPRPATQEIINLHGMEAPYKCSKPWCESFTTGFESAKERKIHIDKHHLPFRCAFEDCFAFRLGYGTQLALDKHKRDHHPEPDLEPRFPGPKPKELNIHQAAELGDLSAVKEILKSNPKAYDAQRSGKPGTPIFLAAKFGNYELLEYLLGFEEGTAQEGVVDLRTEPTALYAATLAGHVDIVRLILNKRPRWDMDPTDQHERSSFCQACALGHLEIVKALLETRKVRVDRCPSRSPECCHDKFSSSTTTPFGYACSEGHLEVVQYLLQHKQYNFVTEEITARTARRGHNAIVNLLCQATGRQPPESIPNDPNIEQTLANYKKTTNGFLGESSGTLSGMFDVSLVHTLPHESAVYCVDISPDGKLVAIGGQESARIYDIVTGDSDSVLLTNTRVLSVRFSPDGRYLATGAKDCFVRLWDPKTKNIRQFAGHRDDVRSVDFASNGQKVASGSNDWTVKLWDIRTSHCDLSLLAEDSVRSIAASPQYIAAGCSNGHVMVWNIANGSPVARIVANQQDIQPTVNSVAFSPDGELISGGRDCMIQCWNPTMAQCIMSWKCPKFVVSAMMTLDRQWIVAVSDSKVLFWGPRTGELQLELKVQADSVALSSTGSYFATGTGGKDSCARIWSCRRV